MTIALFLLEEPIDQFFEAATYFIPKQDGVIERVGSLAFIQTFLDIDGGIPNTGPLPSRKK
jgi:hypothetical protein